MSSREPDPFPYGLASFEPTASGVMLWARTAPGRLRWEVSRDRDFTEALAGGSAHAGASSGAVPGEVSTTVTATGLPAGTDLFYRFFLDGLPSPVGRTRTLPDDDRPVRLGLACCGDYSAGHFAAYRALAEADVDLVVHLGDYVYAEVEGDERRVDPDRAAVTRDDYRRRYAQVRRDPDLQALHLRHPMLAVIDDHDLADNAHRSGAKGHDPQEHGPWADRQAAAVAERLDWLPIRPEGPPGRQPPGQWRSVAVGGLAELVLLDTRLSGRDPQPDVGGPALRAEERTILGVDQLRWATRRVQDRTRPWCLVVSSVVVNEMQFPLPGRFHLNRPFPPGYLIDEGQALNSDGWDGYPGDRDQLVAALRARRTGGVVLSGDVHSGWAFEGPVDDDGPVAVEFTCPAVTSEPMGEMLPVGAKTVERVLGAHTAARWVDLFARGHVIVEVRPESVTATWYVSDSEDPRAQAEVGASWTTLLHEPGRLVATEDLVADGRGPDRPRPEPAPVPPRPPAMAQAARRRLERRQRRLRVLGAALAVAVWRGLGGVR